MNTLKAICMTLAIMFFGLNLQNCDKDCDANCTEIKEAPQDFLDYWFFPEGSWWVYQLEDSTQEVLDTVTLAGTAEYFSEVEIGCFDNNYESCIKRYEAYFEHSSSIYSNPVSSKLGRELFLCQYNPNNEKWNLLQVAVTRKLHSYETFVLYPFDTLDTYAYGGQLCSLGESYQFQGESFQSFTVCRLIAPVGDRQIYHKMTFAKGIGLVSITYDNGETRKLINYHVNP